jgi:hypothetical protein
MAPLHVKSLIITGALITAGPGAALPAAAATALPAMDTSIFACNNGVCEVGPGNVGAPSPLAERTDFAPSPMRTTLGCRRRLGSA